MTGDVREWLGDAWSQCPYCKSRNATETELYACSAFECSECHQRWIDNYGGER